MDHSDNVEDFYAARGERSKLRAFAQEIMDHWPNNGVDGDDLQDIAEKHDLIKPVTRYEQCSDVCQCSEYVSSTEFRAGIVCFVRTDLLTGGNDGI